MNLKVRFRDNEEIARAVDTFTVQVNIQPHCAPPVDVLSIVEIELGLDPVPYPDLFDTFHVDACLMVDMTGIYIDQKAFYDWEAGDRWEEKRLRFSLAHELGHFVLHESEIRANSFGSIEDFRRWAGNRANHQTAEYQADEFAGRLLAPIDVLTDIYDRECARLDGLSPGWRRIEDARRRLARVIAPRLGVNAQVVETRFDREGIWPVS